jgi:mannose-1-phosphate guanylyltransferase
MDEDAVMIVAPSDHYIENEDKFLNYVRDAFEFSLKSDVLMTLGIQPSEPNTGYGYIQFDKDGGDVKKVLDFTEKPDLETAKKFLERGDYLWNAGIFIWSVKSILKAFGSSLPEMYDCFEAVPVPGRRKENADLSKRTMRNPRTSPSITGSWKRRRTFLSWPQNSDGTIWEPGVHYITSSTRISRKTLV